ncbi:hypothetical protein [Candidatus Cyanaurora vandensis]|uniref:hypothetical protein n=1 Tax=Candidatus Cyanaurora vandensis TaxID=2714958 RepID=UPI00257A4905|nr:hypothetical protein [Candidatus Cyanaurora vandensis]
MSKTSLVVLPGATTEGTARFLAQLGMPCLCLEPNQAPYDPWQVRSLITRVPTEEVVVVAFSAGVVGAVGALTGTWLARTGLRVKALIALDGWLVPLFKPFPSYRLSHDHFTHRTCRPLGMGRVNFWADPAVGHLDLWTYPETTQGWAVSDQGQVRTTALVFLQERLTEHGLEP